MSSYFFVLFYFIRLEPRNFSLFFSRFINDSRRMSLWRQMYCTFRYIVHYNTKLSLLLPPSSWWWSSSSLVSYMTNVVRKGIRYKYNIPTCGETTMRFGFSNINIGIPTLDELLFPDYRYMRTLYSYPADERDVKLQRIFAFVYEYTY